MQAAAEPPTARSAGSLLAGSSVGVAVTENDYKAFESLLTGIQTAYSSGDLAKMRSLVTPEMLGYFSEQLSGNASRGVENKVEAVKLEQGDLAEAWSEPVSTTPRSPCAGMIDATRRITGSTIVRQRHQSAPKRRKSGPSCAAAATSGYCRQSQPKPQAPSLGRSSSLMRPTALSSATWRAILRLADDGRSAPPSVLHLNWRRFARHRRRSVRQVRRITAVSTCSRAAAGAQRRRGQPRQRRRSTTDHLLPALLRRGRPAAGWPSRRAGTIVRDAQ
jgi:hypothetical protein